jgi:hypothetical protein
MLTMRREDSAMAPGVIERSGLDDYLLPAATHLCNVFIDNTVGTRRKLIEGLSPFGWL